MGFGESIKTCFSKYVTFKGRASRSELWWFVLFYFIVMAVAGIIDQLLGLQITQVTTDNGTATFAYYPGWVEGLAALALFLPLISVQVRRLHDRDSTGWWWWLSIICCIGGLILIFVFYVQPSMPGPNKYGPEPGPGTA